MFADNDIDTIRSATAYCKDGNKIGGVGDVYLDDANGKPTWVTINTGLFGTKTSFAPLEGATLEGDRLNLAYGKDVVTAAPSIDEDGHLSPEEEAELYRHYSLQDSSQQPAGDGDLAYGGVGRDRDVTDRAVADRAVADRAVIDSGDGSGTVTSEQELAPAQEQPALGQARLRKVSTTDNQAGTGPVTAENVDAVGVPDEALPTDDLRGSDLHGDRIGSDVPVEAEDLTVRRPGLGDASTGR